MLKGRVFPSTPNSDRARPQQPTGAQLPGRVAGVYYCMALSLYPEAPYEEVFAVVAQGLVHWRSWPASRRRRRCRPGSSSKSLLDWLRSL